MGQNILSKTKSTIRFNTKLIKLEGNKPWAFITLPKSLSVKLLLQNKTMIEGTINNLPFRKILELKGKTCHIKISTAMLDIIETKAGDTVSIEITRIGNELETRLPIDLSKLLKTDLKAPASWMDITPMARRDWIFSITTAKQAETRKRRIEKAFDMLKSGKRRLCCFPGIKWMMKENEKTFGMWLPLQNSKK